MSEELHAEPADDHITVWLSLNAEDPDGYVILAAYDSEQMARQHAYGGHDDYQRCAAVLSVRVPRTAFKERWSR